MLTVSTVYASAPSILIINHFFFQKCIYTLHKAQQENKNKNNNGDTFLYLLSLFSILFIRIPGMVTDT